jgi:hypothetical protein
LLASESSLAIGITALYDPEQILERRRATPNNALKPPNSAGE